MTTNYANLSDKKLLDLFTRFTVHSTGASRAVNKPLLLLMVLASVQRGEGGQLRYRDIEERLTLLLRRFSDRTTRSPNPHQPFWRLRNDEGGLLWQVSDAEELSKTLTSSGDVLVGELKRLGVHAGLPDELHRRLVADQSLVESIASRLLGDHFYEGDHEEILDAVGFPWLVRGSPSKPRDPAFRRDVLRVYRGRCAICGYDGRLDHVSVGLDAAHVKARHRGGPDSVSNGLALCSLHHRAYDRGALAISDRRCVLVSEELQGGGVVDDLLVKYANHPLAKPLSRHPEIELEYAAWHLERVFRGPACLHSHDNALAIP